MMELVSVQQELFDTGQYLDPDSVPAIPDKDTDDPWASVSDNQPPLFKVGRVGCWVHPRTDHLRYAWVDGNGKLLGDVGDNGKCLVPVYDGTGCSPKACARLLVPARRLGRALFSLRE